ncbi:MAG TPA: hypothetical protein VFG04_30945 [Planctomycetaceae bacterium]|nr:hypothetical protein [Planctomycetaceae bacterium]
MAIESALRTAAMDRYIPTIGIYEKCNISPVWNMGLIYWFASSGPRL